MIKRGAVLAVASLVSTACLPWSQPATRAVAGLAASQGCLGGPSDSGQARIPWSQLRNPILSYANQGIRDPAVRLVTGRWHVLFTTVTGSAPTWGLSGTSTVDLRSWSPPTPIQQAKVLGLASPDITRRPDGTYVMTYQSDPGEADPPGQAKLYYRTSSDLVHWSGPSRLMGSLHARPSDRLIDAALAWTAHGLLLGYKYGPDGDQHFEVAWSPSGSLAGPWTIIGRPDITVYGDTIENFQFLPINGTWHLLATSNNLDRPWLFTLEGDPAVPQGWLDWSPGRELEVPAERWNSSPGINSVNYEQSDGAYLCDFRRLDGHFYLFYFGANSLGSYGGWGHTVLGVARSTDLVTWQVPCPPGLVSTPVGCA